MTLRIREDGYPTERVVYDAAAQENLTDEQNAALQALYAEFSDIVDENGDIRDRIAKPQDIIDPRRRLAAVDTGDDVDRLVARQHRFEELIARVDVLIKREEEAR
jgi:hypothetical protein